MDYKETINQLESILADIRLTDEQKLAIETAITKLKTDKRIETAIEVVKILAALLDAGSKFFGP